MEIFDMCARQAKLPPNLKGRVSESQLRVQEVSTHLQLFQKTVCSCCFLMDAVVRACAGKSHSKATRGLLHWNTWRCVFDCWSVFSLLHAALLHLCVLWIFAVRAFQTVLISHLPSAGLREESSSLFCLLCLCWSRSAAPVIRRSCGDSSYTSSGEQLDDALLLRTSGWVVSICLTEWAVLRPISTSNCDSTK